MQAISRRKFVATGAMAAGAAALGYRVVSQRNSHRGTIRLLPVEGYAYSESFTRFMNRAKFDSVRDALASIRDRSVPVRVAHISANVHTGPTTVATMIDTKVCQTRRTGNDRAAGNFPVAADSIRHANPLKS